jgi:hypothetical protein
MDSPDLLTSHPSAGRSPIFIGGQPRSGTSLFRVLLNRHPNIACGPESFLLQDRSFRAWHDVLADDFDVCTTRLDLGREAIDRAMGALVDTIFTGYQLSQGKRRWAEKTPPSIFSIDYLLRLFPHAQFVHVIRDPRDTYCSIRERTQRDKPGWVKFSPRHTARDWCTAVLSGMHWRAAASRYHEIRYEDLVSEPEVTMRRVLTFLHEPWDPRVLDARADNDEARHDSQVKRDSIVVSSVGRWRHEMSPRDVAKMEAIAGDLMQDLGYELAT